MKTLVTLLTFGLLSSMFAANMSITMQADSKEHVEKKSPQQLARERREAREKQRLNQNRPATVQRYNNNGPVQAQSFDNRRPAAAPQPRYTERYNRYNQGNNAYRGDPRRMNRRDRINEVNRQMQASREQLDRSRREVQMYQDDLNFFRDKRACYQRARDPRDLDRCDYDFR